MKMNVTQRMAGRGRPTRGAALRSSRVALLAAVVLCSILTMGGIAALANPQDAGQKIGAAGAESTSQPPIHVNVQVVNVPVTVLDRRGIPVIDLTRNDFHVYEDGKLQNIKYFTREPAPPLRIGLVLDTSNAMRPQLKFEEDAASDFVFNMLQSTGTKNEIFLQTFDETSSIVQDFTDDPQVLNDKIRGLKAGGGKALYDAIYFACKNKMLTAGPAEETRRVLVIVSDGLDVQSTHTMEEALSMAHRAETSIYTIGNSLYGFSNPTDKVLDRLAGGTGGAAFFPLEKAPGADLETGYLSHGQIGDTSQNKGLGAETGTFGAERMINLADSLDAINRELGNQYFIGYTPANPALDGTYRTIRVVVDRKGLQVRSKPGYFALRQQAAVAAGQKPGN